MKSFNILALDENFQIIGIVAFINLQWSRKFHESGTFSLSVPLGQYKSTWKYIYTPDRKEVGEITQINYVSKDGFQQMYLSGYFLEEELNRMVVYPYTTEMIGASEVREQGMPSTIVKGTQPTWNVKSGRSNVVAHDFFNAFKTISFKNFPMELTTEDYPENPQRFTYRLNIEDGTSDAGTYKKTSDTRNGEQLGDKIYSILKPSGASFRIRFDFTTAKKYFDVYLGKDRRENNKTNNPVIFSTKYGNITNPNILISDNDTKDCLIQGGEATIYDWSEDVSEKSILVIASASSDSIGRFYYKDIQSVDQPENTYYSPPYYDIKGIYNSIAREELKDRGTVINVDFDAIEGSYEYMVDFDLGDLVSIEIPEIDFSADARLIGCYETIESGVWNLSLEFGTPIIKNK